MSFQFGREGIKCGSPNYGTRDGFQVRQTQLSLPSNSTNLDPKAKRAVTVCNLFINRGLTVSDIARVLDDEYGAVISALIKRGLIKERRQHRGQPQKESNAEPSAEARLLRSDGIGFPIFRIINSIRRT